MMSTFYKQVSSAQICKKHPKTPKKNFLVEICAKNLFFDTAKP